MGLPEKLSALRESAERQLDVLNSQEKTANALLLPFFEALGYDAFNVREVEPGHVVELQGEARNVDYAVKIDGAPAMLFQCAEATTDLNAFDGDPLFRHFDALDTSLVVLTNGLTYRFFADLSGGETVDGRPFCEFDLLDYEPEQIPYLERLTKSEFDTEEVLSAAFELKYTRLLQHYIVQQREEPDAHFVRFLAAQIHEGEVSEDLLHRFQPVVQKLLRQFNMEERRVQRHAPGTVDERDRSTAPHRPEEAEQSQETSPSGETSQAESMSLPSGEKVDVQPHTQEQSHTEEVPSEHRENGKQQNATDSAEGVSEDEDSDNAESENGESDHGDLQGGSNIAKEFANKVVGDS